MRPNASGSPACAFSTRAQTSAAASSGAGRAGQTVCRSGCAGAGTATPGTTTPGTTTVGTAAVVVADVGTPGPGVGVVDVTGGGGTDLISIVSSRADGIVGRSAAAGNTTRSPRWPGLSGGGRSSTGPDSVRPPCTGMVRPG